MRGARRSTVATSSSRRCVFSPATCSAAVATIPYINTGMATAWRPNRSQLKYRESSYASDNLAAAFESLHVISPRVLRSHRKHRYEY